MREKRKLRKTTALLLCTLRLPSPRWSFIIKFNKFASQSKLSSFLGILRYDLCPTTAKSNRVKNLWIKYRCWHPIRVLLSNGIISVISLETALQWPRCLDAKCKFKDYDSIVSEELLLLIERIYTRY